jgi:hypothetical protein
MVDPYNTSRGSHGRQSDRAAIIVNFNEVVASMLPENPRRQGARAITAPRAESASSKHLQFI